MIEMKFVCLKKKKYSSFFYFIYFNKLCWDIYGQDKLRTDNT